MPLAVVSCSNSTQFSGISGKPRGALANPKTIASGNAGAASSETTDVEIEVESPQPTNNVPTQTPTPETSVSPTPVNTASPTTLPTSTPAPNNCTTFLGDYMPVQLIHNQAELAATHMKAGNYKLANDIVMTGNWTPISIVNSVFDGDNFTIRNMKSSGGGLFQTVGVTIMKNVRVDNFEANLNYTDSTKVIGGVGSFAMMVDAATLDNIHVSNGIVRGRASAGGLIGAAISNPSYFCGRQTHSKLINTSATNIELQTIGANLFAGGIAGEYVNYTDISGSTFSQITWRKFDNVLNRLGDTTSAVTQLAGRVSGNVWPP